MGRRAKHKSKPVKVLGRFRGCFFFKFLVDAHQDGKVLRGVLLQVSQDAALASATPVLCPAPAELRRRISDASGASRRPSDVSDASDVEVNQ